MSFCTSGNFNILIIGSGIAQHLRLDWNIHNKKNIFTHCSDKLCGRNYKYTTVMYRLCYVRGVCVCARVRMFVCETPSSLGGGSMIEWNNCGTNMWFTVYLGIFL